MEFKEFLSQFDISATEAIEFLNNNDWFGNRPVLKDGVIMLSDVQISLFTDNLKKYLSKGTTEDLLNDLKARFPDTAKVIMRFFKDVKVPDETRFYLMDFLLINLEKDIVLYSNDDIERLLNVAAVDLIHAHAELLTFFLSYVRTKRKTKYYKDYGMTSRKLGNNDAYTFEEYIEILYYLFNEDYIFDNDMYARAARSKNYTDTWLFLALHFVCALRMTDMERIYHPVLPKDPETVLEEIEKGTFSDSDAREVLLSITRRLCVLPLKPNKTKRAKNIPNIKFIIPHSCEVHIGTLFALAEAHQQVSGKTGPIVRKIASFEEITRYMGEDIGVLFLQSNFRSRKANKSFLQAIEALSGEVLGEDGLQVKGYMLAALARSHKSGYGQFAATAATYLKDAALTGLTPQFVALELFERGVLSFVPSMLLNIITNGAYKQLDASDQTQLVKELGLSPKEVEDVVSVVNRSQRQAQEAIIQAVSDEIPVLEVLHNIGSGAAFSKQPECMCLLSAVYKNCPYSNAQCIGCQFEISTKSTLLQLAAEYKRMADIYKNSNHPLERKKYKKMIRDVIVPKLEEMLIQLKDTYGDDVYNDYSKMVKNYVE